LGDAFLTRRRLLAAAGLALASLVGRGSTAWGAARPLLDGLRVGAGRAFAGDGRRLATVGRAGRATARLRFRLARPAVVTFDVLQTGQGVASEQPLGVRRTGLSAQRLKLPAGAHTLDWTPDPALPPRTYVLRLSARSGGKTHVEQATVRVLGVDAGFTVGSVRQGGSAGLVVRTDARSLRLQLLRCGPETEETYANDELKGVPVGEPVEHDWSRRQNAPAALYLAFPAELPSGIYAARLDADDGRVGFAPIVVAPAVPAHRVAVVVPVTTWQAYNFYDEDGDGWGDTWYARWRTRELDLRRPHARRGVPYRFRSYELGFYHWLFRRGVEVDWYADGDLEAVDPAALREAYDLLVFPGHTEYVTAALYDAVAGFRDRGGNLLFLSANNFFRRVDREGNRVRLVDEWRKLGRPESALCGVQYIASDRGERHAPFTVTGADLAPWAFEGTGLANGSQFGLYGIEIDARASTSPPGTTVLATLPDLFGPGRSGEMVYYEHSSGARVFSAGVLNFGGQVLLWPEATRLLENVWRRLGGP